MTGAAGQSAAFAALVVLLGATRAPADDRFGDRRERVRGGRGEAAPGGRITVQRDPVRRARGADVPSDDVAGAVAYLVSDEAAYVTGQVLSVSDGLTRAG